MKLLWIDLETTGLDPAVDAILEMAVIEADFDNPFKPLNKQNFVLYYKPIVATEASLTIVPGLKAGEFLQKGRAISQVVVDMHQASGLWSECERSGNMLSAVENQLVYRYGVRADAVDDRPIVAGSSVHFDMGFLKAHMPRFHQTLSYRLYDTRTIQLFCRSLGMPQIPKKEAHRAMLDIEEAMDVGAQCARWLTDGRFDA